MGSPELATPVGLPRPRMAGRPVPWITEIGPHGPRWRRVDPARVLACQREWRCQSCGLPDYGTVVRAWAVVADPSRTAPAARPLDG